MKPENLFVEAAGYVKPLGNIAIMSSPERQRYDEDMSKFKDRVDRYLDRAKDYVDTTSPFDCDYEEVVEEIVAGGVRKRYTTRVAKIYTTPEDELFRQLVPSDNAEVNMHITLAARDIEFQDSNDEWGEKQKVASCDIVTELEGFARVPEELVSASAEEIMQTAINNPFEGFQVLERLNWNYPILRDENTDVSSTELFSTDTVVTTQAIYKAYARSAQGWEAALGNMHGALDEFQDVLPKLREYDPSSQQA